MYLTLFLGPLWLRLWLSPQVVS